MTSGEVSEIPSRKIEWLVTQTGLVLKTTVFFDKNAFCRAGFFLQKLVVVFTSLSIFIEDHNLNLRLS